MGLTIHYKLHADVPTAEGARRRVAELHEFAKDLPFEHVFDVFERTFEGDEYRDLDRDDPEFFPLISAGHFLQHGDDHLTVPPKHVFAFVTFPGEGCEPAVFGLAQYPETMTFEGREIRTKIKNWAWWSFCKTQYASNPIHGGMDNFLRCHRTVVELLDFARKIGIVNEVIDEGEFWQHRDADRLKKMVTEWNAMIAGFAGKMKDALGEHVEAEIATFPNFEHLEAKGRRHEGEGD